MNSAHSLLAYGMKSLGPSFIVKTPRTCLQVQRFQNARVERRHRLHDTNSLVVYSNASETQKENWLPENASIDADSQAILEKFNTMFQRADANGDGVLSKEELRIVLESVGNGDESIDMHWMTDDDLDGIMRQYDTNADGVISFEEFQYLAQDNVFLSLALADYKRAFNAIDKGRNGKIGPTELFQLFQDLDSPMQGYENIVELMEKYDVNQDGEIDFPEFLRLCRFEDTLPLGDILSYQAKKSAENGAKVKELPPGTYTPTLEPGKVHLITSESEFVNIMESNKDTLIVLLATLTWCRPCKRILVPYQKCAAAYKDSIFVKFHGNENEDTKRFFKEKLKVRVTPSFFFFRNEELLGSCTGANSERFETNLRSFFSDEHKPEKSLYIS